MSAEPVVILVSAGVTALGGVWDELRVRAELNGCELVVLPPPGSSGRPGADAAERRRLARRDLAELTALARGMRGRSPVALLVTPDEVAGQAGRAWHHRLAQAADRAGVLLPRAVRVHPGDAIDLAELEALTLPDPPPGP